MPPANAQHPRVQEENMDERAHEGAFDDEDQDEAGRLVRPKLKQAAKNSTTNSTNNQQQQQRHYRRYEHFRSVESTVRRERTSTIYK